MGENWERGKAAVADPSLEVSQARLEHPGTVKVSLSLDRVRFSLCLLGIICISIPIWEVLKGWTG